MQKPNITFEQFLTLDVRICEILKAERVPKKDKLLQLTINTGFDERIAITNIGAHYEPEVLIGMKMPFILNLVPTKIAGIESTAMILAINGDDDKPLLFLSNANTGNVII